ncbi:MAG: aminoglycoside phosphotransferase family protein [Firmicutes bacterium]|nr:aminoglycoside phosphotransferase family protein [Bacillota bacterium]
MGSTDDVLEARVAEALDEKRLLLGTSGRSVVREGVRALAGEALPLVGVHEAAHRIRRTLEARRPFSLIRLGDAEALTLAQGLVLSPEEAARRLPLLAETRVVTPAFGARDALLQAIGEADLVGVPLARIGNYQPLLARALEEAGVHLPRGRLTSSVINYELRDRGYWRGLLAGRRVLVVGGPGERFAAWLRSRGVDVQGAVVPVRGFPDLEATLRRCRAYRFDVALVSAGVTACLLCPRLSRELGVVALDIGHAADETLAGDPFFKPVRRPEGPLTLADLNEVSGRAGRAWPHATWIYEEIQSRGATSTGRYTAFDEDDEAMPRRWSFIAKTHRPEVLEAEARGAAWARESRSVRVPRVYLATARFLAQEELEGTVLPHCARPAWRRAMRALARFHAEMRAAAGAGGRGAPAAAAGDPTGADSAAGGVLPEVPYAAWREDVERTLERAEAAAVSLPEEDRHTLRELRAAWRELSALEPADDRTTFTHGDLHAHNILVPEEPSLPPGFVDWETAALRLPVFDVSSLTDGLAPAWRDELLAEYASARRDAGWPCDVRDFLHDYTVVHTLRVVEMTAWTLADVAARPAAAAGGLLRALRHELWKARAHPARDLPW